MRALKWKPFFQSAILIVIGNLFFYTPAPAQDKILTVIGNSKGVPDQMKMTQLKEVLHGEKQRWSSSVPVVIALMKSSTEAGMSTSKKIFEMNMDEFNKYWLALVFQGKVKAPVFFHSAAELELFVTETPGAIGVIELPVSEKVKQITIDGKKSF